jgi:hypothetical protein
MIKSTTGIIERTNRKKVENAWDTVPDAKKKVLAESASEVFGCEKVSLESS